MTDDIVARLRAVLHNDRSVELMNREAADEIAQLRGQIEHHARDRIEYCAAWSKWIEEHDGLEIAQWCRAYADAVPYPNPDGPEIVRVIHSRLDARHRMAADEIERLRAERDALLEQRANWIAAAQLHAARANNNPPEIRSHWDSADA